MVRRSRRRCGPATGNRFAYFEHTYRRIEDGEVDGDLAAGATLDTIPSVVAVRSRHGLLARFDLDKSADGVRYAWELYRYTGRSRTGTSSSPTTTSPTPGR